MKPELRDFLELIEAHGTAEAADYATAWLGGREPDWQGLAVLLAQAVRLSLWSGRDPIELALVIDSRVGKA